MNVIGTTDSGFQHVSNYSMHGPMYSAPKVGNLNAESVVSPHGRLFCANSSLDQGLESNFGNFTAVNSGHNCHSLNIDTVDINTVDTDVGSDSGMFISTNAGHEYQNIDPDVGIQNLSICHDVNSLDSRSLWGTASTCGSGE